MSRWWDDGTAAACEHILSSRTSSADLLCERVLRALILSQARLRHPNPSGMEDDPKGQSATVSQPPQQQPQQYPQYQQQQQQQPQAYAAGTPYMQPRVAGPPGAQPYNYAGAWVPTARVSRRGASAGPAFATSHLHRSHEIPVRSRRRAVQRAAAAAGLPAAGLPAAAAAGLPAAVPAAAAGDGADAAGRRRRRRAARVRLRLDALHVPALPREHHDDRHVLAGRDDVARVHRHRVRLLALVRTCTCVLPPRTRPVSCRVVPPRLHATALSARAPCSMCLVSAALPAGDRGPRGRRAARGRRPRRARVDGACARDRPQQRLRAPPHPQPFCIPGCQDVSECSLGRAGACAGRSRRARFIALRAPQSSSLWAALP